MWIDGALVAPDEARVSVFDHGVTVGDGVFETLKVAGGRPFAVRRHLERLGRSARALGLDVPVTDATLRGVLDEVLAASGLADARLRITLTAGVTPLGSGRGGARRTPPSSSPPGRSLRGRRTPRRSPRPGPATSARPSPA